MAALPRAPYIYHYGFGTRTTRRSFLARNEVTMQTPAKISFRNFEHSDAVEARVLEKIAKLETFYDRIVGCSVVVEAPHRHHTKGKLYHVDRKSVV